MWRCFPAPGKKNRHADVFSTHVEVFLDCVRVRGDVLRFLHACGGVSGDEGEIAYPMRFSPRMWRCFLMITLADQIIDRFLHACGGVSTSRALRVCQDVFSPRMWRCFHCVQHRDTFVGVFSTHVEVFLSISTQPHHRERFLHACGGVSKGRKALYAFMKFSPRMWRCFC